MTARDHLAVPRKLVSALLMAAVGVVCGAALLGLMTFYVYFLGVYLGVGVGIVGGAWLGWRTPLQDSVLVFVTFYVGMIAGSWLAKKLVPTMSNDHWAEYFLPILLPVVGAVAALLLIYLPTRRYLPSEKRRVVAMALSVVIALYVFVRLIQFGYFWQPS